MAFLRELRGNSLNPQTSSGLEVYSRISLRIPAPLFEGQTLRRAQNFVRPRRRRHHWHESTSIHVEHVFAMDLAVETLEPAAQFSFWHAMLREASRRRVPRGVDKGWKSSSKSPFASSGRDGATLGASFFRDRGLGTNALES